MADFIVGVGLNILYLNILYLNILYKIKDFR